MLRHHGTPLGSEHAAEQLRQPAGRHELGIGVLKVSVQFGNPLTGGDEHGEV